MVTRSIKVTKANVLVADLSAGKIEETSVVISGTFSSEKKLDAALHDALDNDGYHLVKRVSAEVREVLYGMSESDFIKLAVELDPDTRRPIEQETQEHEAQPETKEVPEKKTVKGGRK